MRHLGLAVMLAFVGCIDSSSVVCGDLRCAEGTVCVQVTPAPGVAGQSPNLCVRADQLTACAGADELASCTTETVATGRCYDHVCLPAGCGNGRVDPDEVCDDANGAAGDGCSASCRSDETCGNGVLDPFRRMGGSELCDDGGTFGHDGCSAACTNETPRWTRLVLGAPAPRSGHSMVFAARRGRVVLFGGADASKLYDDVWEWDGTGWRQPTPTLRPSARAGHASAYDVDRDRVVVFGGCIPGFQGTDSCNDETWEWDGSHWTAQTASNSPGARSGAAMAYHAGRKRIVMFGGNAPRTGGFTVYNDPSTWEWDGTSWSIAVPDSTNHPPVMRDHAMAYDPRRDVVVLVGHELGFQKFVQWEYDGSGAWVSIESATTPPAVRDDASFAFDAASGKLVLAGGTNGIKNLDDVWTWDGTQWEQLPTMVIGRADAAIAPTPIPSAAGTMVMFGGDDGSAKLGDTQSFGATAWSPVTTTGPGSRDGHAAAFDAVRSVLVVQGGSAGGATTWELDGSTWRELAAGAPARLDHAMAYDLAHRQVVLFGGSGGGGLGNTFTYDGTVWTEHAVAGPAPRAGLGMAYDANAGEIVLFGGMINNTVSDETWRWNGSAWSPATPAHKPSARAGHSMSYDPIRKRIVLFGGSEVDPITGDVRRFDDTWEWDGVDWTKRLLAARPSKRQFAAMTWDPARRTTILSGGESALNAVLDDTWELGLNGWSFLDLPVVPDARQRHILAPAGDGRGIVLYGGIATSTSMSDLWSLRWDGVQRDDTCDGASDLDGDGQRGCGDPDCFATCAPLCPPGLSCDPTGPRCGDATCSALETCRSCPTDCGACAPACGDAVCDPGELMCPGDCP